jgi:multidrug efflux pump subunit AcrA (membrane-fusion protein)
MTIRRFAMAITLTLTLALTACTQSDGGGDEVAHEPTLWTCGMDPQVIEDEPGSCPICGMDLVPMVVEREGEVEVEVEVEGGHERKVAYWVAPMDPTYVRDEPGKSPMGMDLVPVYADDGGPPKEGRVVAIDPVVVQNMGVRTARVERGPIFRHVRSIGEIEVAEDAISVVNLRYSGWIEKIRVDETGVEVRKGQVLFEIYSPELVAAQEEYLLALQASGDNDERASSARTRLSLWDVPDSEIEALVARGEASRTMAVRAPRSGYVLHKQVVEGARVVAGQDLYRIGNLQTIWIRTEVYEFDAPWVQVGQRAIMELAFARGAPIEGTVGYVYPTLNPNSRTLTVRIEFPNPGLQLRPGMTATVLIETRRQDDAVRVPTEAILHDGLRQFVFVAQDYGRYAPRDIQTGLVGDRRLTEVLSGLEAGDEVVVSGQFLLDSESQLNEALDKLLAERLQPRPEGEPAPTDPHAGHDHGADDGLFVCPMHPDFITDDGDATCPVCGMDLVPVE